MTGESFLIVASDSEVGMGGLSPEKCPSFYISGGGQKELLIEVSSCLGRSLGFRDEPDSEKQTKC